MIASGPPANSGATLGGRATASADTWTIVAIAIVAYALGSIIHEGIGHGGACLITGGHPVALSTVHFDCDREGRFVDAGGTLANFAAGLIFWIAARAVSRKARLRYFLWLSMTINFLTAGGHFLFSGVGNIGDWAAVIAGLQPAWLWRVGLVLFGIGSYMLFVAIAIREMRPFLGRADAGRPRRAKKLTLVPYFAGGILSCVAGMFNPVGLILVGISAAAASFGGTSGLAWMWQLFRGQRIPESSLQMAPLSRSWGWVIAGGVLGLLFIFALGPGVKFHWH
jgi:hypothetical protein